MKKSEALKQIQYTINGFSHDLKPSQVRVLSDEILTTLENCGMLPPNRMTEVSDHSWDDVENEDETI